MRHFMLISFDPRTPANPDLQQQAIAALQRDDNADIDVHTYGDPTTLWRIEHRPDPALVAPTQQDAWLVSRSKGLRFTGEHHTADPHQLLTQWQQNSTDTLARIAPPAAWYGGDAQEAFAATDVLGLGHVYVHQGDGFAAAASSCALLGRVFGLDVDWHHLMQLFCVGFPLGEQTPVRNVRKLPPGHAVWLTHGRADVRQQADVFATIEQPPANDTSAIADTATLLRTIVAEQLDAHPQAELELTGGIDSRLVLAAIAPEKRKQVTAFTLGRQDATDVVMARRIAEAFDLPHVVVDTAGVANLDADALGRLMRTACRDAEFSLNPVDRCLVHYVNQQHHAEARFSGVCGEYFSGFYYAMQPLDQPPSDALIRRLVQWRLISNDRADPRLFESQVATEAVQQVEQTAIDVFPRATTWARSLDDFYLMQRMHRWSGLTLSALMPSRAILAPFFDPRWIRQVASLPTTCKNGYQLHVRLICEADPFLADLPLTGRPAPRHLLQPRWTDRLRMKTSKLMRGLRKVRQQYAGASRTSNAMTDLLAKLRQDALLNQLNHDRLMAQTIFDRDHLQRCLTGEVPLDRGSLATLWLTDTLLDTLA